MLIITPVIAQDKGIVQGIILDKEANNKPLHFVNVSIKKYQKTVNIDNTVTAAQK